MSKFIIRFSSKTSSPSLSDAIKIAEDHEYYIDNSFYFVHFKDVNKDLERLVDIVGRWKASKSLVDEKEVPIRDFKDVFFCDYKLICNGVCRHIWLGKEPLDRLFDINKEINNMYTSRFTINSLAGFLEKKEDNKFRLDKNKIIDYIKDRYSLEIDYCPKINIEKIFNDIEKLPETLQIYDKEETEPENTEKYQQLYEEELEFETRKKAEIFAEVFEKKLRKIIKEELGERK